MENIILTGFDIFGPYEYNPTLQSAIDFDGRIIGNRKVHGIVLPSTYDA